MSLLSPVGDAVVSFDRFVFQRLAVAGVPERWTVLNVGCHVDGARLRESFPEQVKNCDIAVQEGYDYPVDALFDAREPWPIRGRAAVMADILEHHYDHEIVQLFWNARGAGVVRLCLTWPEDSYFWRDGLAGVADVMGYRSHCNEISLGRMTQLLNYCGFEVVLAVAGSQGLLWDGEIREVPSHGVLAAWVGASPADRNWRLGVDPLGGVL